VRTTTYYLFNGKLKLADVLRQLWDGGGGLRCPPPPLHTAFLIDSHDGSSGVLIIVVVDVTN